MSTTPSTSLERSLERLFRRTAHGIRPGLDLIRQLLARLDHPEQSLPLIHVAGTNGKGSVCAMIESVLRHAGVRTGLYTSPHLVRFNERIQVAGSPISDQQLAECIERIETVADAITEETGDRPATFFECATAMAFTHFQATHVEAAVVETGMGGLWDATNVGHPLCSVITRIDVDHVAFLGRDVSSIAAEKAGIIKPGIPVISSRMSNVAWSVIEKTALDNRSPLIRADETVQIERIRQDWSGQQVRIATPERTLPPIRLPLIGRHQLENAALAVAALETLHACGRFDLPDEAFVNGLTHCIWPGRAQVVATDPVVLLDVAHNPNGASALASLLEEVGGSVPAFLIVGFLNDKDVHGCLEAFARVARHIWAVPIESDRAMSPDDIRASGEGLGVNIRCATLSEALEQAKGAARAEGGVVCIAGSLYLAGEVLQRVEQSS